MEAECHAMCACIREGTWLMYLLGEIFGKVFSKSPVSCDNKTSVGWVMRTSVTDQSKHFRPKLYFMKKQEKEEIDVRWVPSSLQKADVMTKASGNPQFGQQRIELCVLDKP